MSNIAKAAVFTSNKNLASEIKEKCQKYGLEVSYITRLYDFLSHIISASNEIIFVDHKFNKTKNALSDFCKRYDNNIKIDIVTHVNNSYTQFCAFGTMSFIINILLSLIIDSSNLYLLHAKLYSDCKNSVAPNVGILNVNFNIF